MVASVRVGINNTSAILERCLDVPGYIPFVSSYSAYVRLTLAHCQLITSIGMAIFGILAEAYRRLGGPLDKCHVQELHYGCIENLSSAILNYLRGAIELVPILNLVLIFTDQLKAASAESWIDLPGLPKVSNPLFHLPIMMPNTLKQPFQVLEPGNTKATTAAV